MCTALEARRLRLLRDELAVAEGRAALAVLDHRLSRDQRREARASAVRARLLYRSFFRAAAASCGVRLHR